MQNDPQTQALLESFKHFIPEMVLGLAACILFVGGTIRKGRNLWGGVALTSLGVAFVAFFLQPEPLSTTTEIGRAGVYSAAFFTDPLATFVKIVALAGGALLLLLSWNEVSDSQATDHHACLLVIVAGLSLTAAANDLITLFLSLELISIPTYILLYLPRHDEAAQEAAMKYFLLSIFSSAFVLFGFSYLYGLTGTTNLGTLQATLAVSANRELPVSLAALVMVIAGLGFRITAVPFHFYAPDVYEGTSTSGAALLAFVPKVAGFVALMKVLGFVLPDPAIPARDIGLLLSNQTPIVLWLLAAITMCVGNFLALLQNNLKRLLAYSSVAHAGYMLIALSVAPYLRGGDGVSALLYYLVAYGVMTVGAFGVIAYLHSSQRPIETVDDLAGLGSSHPGVAFMMVVFLFSLIGIPLTAGFTGKFLIFFGAMSAEATGQERLFRILALIAVANAAIGAWYYLRIVAAMYLRNPLKPAQPRRTTAGMATLCICAVLTVALSIPPAADWLLNAVREAAGPARAPAVQAKR